MFYMVSRREYWSLLEPHESSSVYLFDFDVMHLTNQVKKTEYLFYVYAERIVTDLESTPHSSKNPLAALLYESGPETTIR